MQLMPDSNQGKYFIRSYRPGAITINENIYEHSVIVTPASPIISWRPQTFAELIAEDFITAIEQSPEIILIGSGSKQQFPQIFLLRLLIEHSIGYEIMNTAAACRTYNALSNEGRKVVAALLIQ